jgi:hypothetical protein
MEGVIPLRWDVLVSYGSKETRTEQITMKITKEDVLKLAKQAGYGIQTNAYATDGVHCDRFEDELWGGCMETNRLIAYSQLLVEMARVDWELEQERKLSFTQDVSYDR